MDGLGPAAVRTGGAADPRLLARRPRSLRVGGLMRFVAPPLVAYLLSHTMYAVAAARGGYDYLTAQAHARFDALHYLTIAEDGYRMFRCGENPALAANYGADSWCGNAGWFPLYSWLVAALRALTGLSPKAAGIVVAELATLAIVLLAWWLLVRVLPRRSADVPARTALARALAVLAVIMLIPAGIYFHASFPMSLAVAAMLAYTVLLAEGRWVWAGLAGAGAAAAYPIGVVVAVLGLVTVAALAWRRQLSLRRAVGSVAAVCGLPAVGVLTVFAAMQITVGHWNGYFLTMAHYSGGRGHNPIANFHNEVSRPARVWVRDPEAHLVERLHPTVHLAVWAALGLVVLVVVAAASAAVQGRLIPLDIGLTAFAVAMFLAPLIVGNQVVQYRSHTLLVPGLIVLRHLPAWLLWPLALALVPLAYRMGTLFFPSLLT